MEFEKTSLWADVRKIFTDKAKPIRFAYSAKIHTDKDDVEVYKILNLDIERNYHDNIGDNIILECVIPFGKYLKTIYPKRHNLECTITKQQLLEAGIAASNLSGNEIERFKMVLIPGHNPEPSGSEYNGVDEHTLNHTKIATLKAQLLNRSIEPLRIKTTGGIFKNVKQKDILESILLGESKNILIDGKPSIDGVDVVEPNNNEKVKHVVIPHGTHVTSIPTYFQEQLNGIYNGGIGTYLQSVNGKRIWFVYPLYDFTRFDQNVKKMIIYVVPKNRFPMVERTYRQQGDIVYLAASNEKSYTDSGEANLMNAGGGFRMSDARSFMKKPVQITKNGPMAVRSRLNFEVAAKARKDGLNYAPLADSVISSNPFVEFSKVMRRSGGHVNLNWVNSNPSLIYPGMPCKYIFLDKNNVLVEKRGVILNAHSIVQLDGDNMSATTHRTTTNLSLFIEPIDEEV